MTDTVENIDNYITNRVEQYREWYGSKAVKMKSLGKFPIQMFCKGNALNQVYFSTNPVSSVCNVLR